jgi:hypothetical protein
MKVQFPCTLVARALAPRILMPLSIALPLVSRRSFSSCCRPAPLKPSINVLAMHIPQIGSHFSRNLSIVFADQLTAASLRQGHPVFPSPGPLIRGTSYIPILQNVMVPKRLATGLSLDDLYLNSISAIRHTLHKSLYGQYAYSLVRMEVYVYPVKTASAIEWALHHTAIFWALPLLHALVANALLVLKGNPFAYTRLPRCAARARRHRYQKNCYRYRSQMLVRCFLFYLIMFYMGGDPSSGHFQFIVSVMSIHLTQDSANASFRCPPL